MTSADGATDAPYVVVVGGANVDVKSQTNVAAVPMTSNPGHTSLSTGGVGRNIAENLARLGTRSHLVAAIGTDVLGEWLVAQTARAGVGLRHVHRTSRATGTYTAVLDVDGELIVAVAAMDATDDLSPAQLASSSALRAGAALIVLDGNLSVEVLTTLLDDAATDRVRVLLDPVSDPKAQRIASVLSPSRPMFVITPNRTELAVLTGLAVDTPDKLVTAADALVALGVENVWVRLGAEGSLLCGRDGVCTPIPAIPVDVLDVTGAGDAMAGAFVHALVSDRSLIDSATFAHAAAALTIASVHTVRPDLTVELVEAELARVVLSAEQLEGLS